MNGAAHLAGGEGLPATAGLAAAATAPRAVPLAKIDRCWVPLDDPAAVRYVARSLFVPHGLGRRLAWTAAGWTRGASSRVSQVASLTAILHPGAGESEEHESGRRDGAAARADALRLEEQASLLYALLDDLRDALPAAPSGRPSWLLIEDYDAGPRLVCLLFAGGAQPAGVLKVRPLDDPAPLAAVRNHLESLRPALPPPLAATVPAPLAYHERGGFAGLLLAPLAGRSAYVAMSTAWRPSALAPRHLAAAVEWLAAFQAATTAGEAGATIEPVASLRLRLNEMTAGAAGWLDRLARLADLPPAPASAVHGDFWARNLILPPGGGLPGVVDWEAARKAGPCTEDLFHFALTYALHSPAARWRRLPPRDAFRRGFLDDGGLGRALRDYFHAYAQRTGLEPRRLGDWFAAFLLERAVRTAEAPPARPAARLPYRTFLEDLTCADPSAFSG